MTESPRPARRTRALVAAASMILLLSALVAVLPRSGPNERTDSVGAGAAGSGVVDGSKPTGPRVSPPLREIAPSKTLRSKPKGTTRGDILPHPKGNGGKDPVAQRTLRGGAVSGPSRNALTAGTGFDGPGNGNMTVQYAPPDPNSAVGPNHIVTAVNVSFTVHDKSGTRLYGPAGNNTIFSGFGGACQTTNDGDPIVRYDRLADRWFFTQFANVASATGPYYECVAVSTSPDPLGTWNRYAFSYANFPDYPKVGVWPDAYYVSYNMFTPAGAWVGPQVCAMDRTRMLAGQTATQQCFAASSSYGALLPADLDGSTPPPSGAPNVSVALGTFGSAGTTLGAWKFKVDWTTPANSTFTQVSNIAVASYTPACSGGTCIVQPGTTNRLDSLADRLMNRLAYRNFGTHESLVVTHAVTSGSIGVRWYELRLNASGNPTVHQQGTYVPDANSRWMSSAAMDRVGNLAIGYSVTGSSGATIYPSLRATGRLAGDTLGTLTQGELTLATGGGPQTGTLTRWGDYASMNIDPSDDCTFWFTGEYEPASGSYNWRTRVASFTLPGCAGPVTPDFSMSASPATLTVSPSGSATATIGTATTAGAAQSVGLSVSGLPAGATATFSPTSVTSGGSSTLTVSTASTTPLGTYPLTITGTGTSATRTTTVSLTVANPDFSMSVTPSTVSAGQGSSATATVATTAIGTPQSVALSIGGLPTGATASFSPTSVTAGGSSTLTVSAASTTPLGTYSLTVTGTGTSAIRTSVVSMTVTPSNVVLNPGFETGTLSSWTAVGTNSAVTQPRTGSYSARAGSTVATNGDSRISQTFKVPAGATTLSFWYRISCPDTVRYDWVTATLRDMSTTKNVVILPKTCSNTGTWVKVSKAVTAGKTYLLTLISHDDNLAADPTYTLFDDIAVT